MHVLASFGPILFSLSPVPIMLFEYLAIRDNGPSRWGDPEHCETLWVIHGGDHVKPPFGQTVYYS